MGEDDDLPARRRRLQDAREPVHARGVHGLDGIVDDHEAERALLQRGPRDEEAQGQGVELALAHHAQGGGGHAVHGHVEVHAALARRAHEVDLLDLDVAAAQQLVADGLRALGDGGEALVTQLPRRVLEPFLRRLDGGDGGGAVHGLARDGDPARQVHRDGAPAVLAARQLRGGRLPQRVDRAVEGDGRRLEVAGEHGQVGARAVGQDLLPVLDGLEGGCAVLPEPESGAELHDGRRGHANRHGRLARALRFRARGGGRGRGLAEGRGLPLLLLVPLRAERAAAVADGTGPVAVRVVEGQGAVEQLGELARAAGHGARDRALVLVRLAQAAGDARDVLLGGSGQRAQALEGADRGLVLARGGHRARQHALDRLEVPVLPVEGAHDHARALVVGKGRAEGGDDPGLHEGRVLLRPLAGQARVGQALLRGDEVLEAQDGGQPVVELGRPLVQHRAQLVVRQAGPVRPQRLVPAQPRPLHPALKRPELIHAEPPHSCIPGGWVLGVGIPDSLDRINRIDRI